MAKNKRKAAMGDKGSIAADSTIPLQMRRLADKNRRRHDEDAHAMEAWAQAGFQSGSEADEVEIFERGE